MQEPGFVQTFVRGAEWAATGQVSNASQPKPKKRLLVVTGGHAYEPSFYTLFDGFEWNHVAGVDQAFRKDVRENYDAVLLYNMEQAISDRSRRNLQDFVESGKGVVILHHAIADFGDWPWWFREVAGGKYLLKPEGATPGSTYRHDVEFVVKPAGKHPILAGIPEFHIRDEAYKGKWISPKVNVLLKVDHPDADAPVAWVSPYPKARVAAIILGHDHFAYVHPTFRRLVVNAVNWAASN
jgi:type 1 glutamine amidotransferase